MNLNKALKSETKTYFSVNTKIKVSEGFNIELLFGKISNLSSAVL